MAGRAGRRGLDKIGHVIHCNNLFDIPTAIEYRKITTGAPKMLTSQFTFSYTLFLNILKSLPFGVKITKEELVCEVCKFIDNSFLKKDIDKEISVYERENADILREIQELEKRLEFLSTSKNDLEKYTELLTNYEITTGKQKKKVGCLANTGVNRLPML